VIYIYSCIIYGPSFCYFYPFIYIQSPTTLSVFHNSIFGKDRFFFCNKTRKKALSSEECVIPCVYLYIAEMRLKKNPFSHSFLLFATNSLCDGTLKGTGLRNLLLVLVEKCVSFIFGKDRFFFCNKTRKKAVSSEECVIPCVYLYIAEIRLKKTHFRTPFFCSQLIVCVKVH